MAVRKQFLAICLEQVLCHGSHIVNDVADRNSGAKAVVGGGYVKAAGCEGAGKMGEVG